MLLQQYLLSDIKSCEERRNLISQTYRTLFTLGNEYLGFREWFDYKVVPNISKGKRDIFIVKYQNDIAGILITKNDIEKKICTLRVSERYRGAGIGKRLFVSAFNILETDKPIITVSGIRAFEFNRLLKYYGFNLEKVYRNYYKRSSIELSYNGLLNEDTNSFISRNILERVAL